VAVGSNSTLFQHKVSLKAVIDSNTR